MNNKLKTFNKYNKQIKSNNKAFNKLKLYNYHRINQFRKNNLII